MCCVSLHEFVYDCYCSMSITKVTYTSAIPPTTMLLVLLLYVYNKGDIYQCYTTHYHVVSVIALCLQQGGTEDGDNKSRVTADERSVGKTPEEKELEETEEEKCKCVSVLWEDQNN